MKPLDSKWDKMVQKTFYALVSFCAVFAVDSVKSLSHSVEELNRNVAVLLESVSRTQADLKDHEYRLRALEVRKNK